MVTQAKKQTKFIAKILLAVLLIVLVGGLGLGFAYRDKFEDFFYPERRIVGHWNLFSSSNYHALSSHYPIRYGFDVILTEEDELRVTNFDDQVFLDYDTESASYKFRRLADLPGMISKMELVDDDKLNCETKDGVFLQYRRGDVK